MAEAPSPQLPEVVSFVGHLLEDAGLLAGIGSFVVRRVGRLSPRIGWANPPMSRFFGIAFAGGLVLFAVDHTWLIAARAAAEGVAYVLCRRGTPLVALPAVLAAVLLPFSGHAARVTPSAGAEFADMLHVLSAAMWAGGIIALASLQPPTGWGSPQGRLLVERFGRVAVIAFGVTALTGLLRATEQLNGISDVWTTPYGVVLALKVVGVLAMLGVSAVWRRGRPVARLDAVAVVFVVAATALLAVLPSPA
ncbi:MAG TPA: CopD family protein [Candidatus Dormibacteraeota bacterium]|nr:CopD family protein [Candidatus Dormibacteraeota bacterium]